jgi:hypothetical protein
MSWVEQLAPETPLRRYHLYGVVVETGFVFANAMHATDAAPEVRLLVRPRPPRGTMLPGLRHLGDDAAEAEGLPFCSLYTFDGGLLLRYTRVADFVLTAQSVVCLVHDTLEESLGATVIELRFLGPVMALWLEMRGVLALHASAAVVDGHAIGFLSHNRGGKTSVAATLVQRGHEFLADDLLAITPDNDVAVAHAGFPSARMWPTEAEHFLGSTRGLALAHPYYEKLRVPVDDGIGRCTATSHPLLSLYVLERVPGLRPRPYRIASLASRDGLSLLMRHSTAPFLSTAGLAPERLMRLVGLLHDAPVRHVRHDIPNAELPRLADAIVHDALGRRAVARTGA